MYHRPVRADLTAPPVERRPNGELYSLTAAQQRKVQTLVKNCCNYDGGSCLMMDDGPCAQASSGVICCRWFRAAILEDPAHAVLKAEIFQDSDTVKQCVICGESFVPKSNRTMYCRACAKKVRHKKEADRQKALRRGAGVRKSTI